MHKKYLLIAALCLSCLMLPAAAHAGACPDFRLTQKDRINSVFFPAGPYMVVNSGMSCAKTTKYLQQFLDEGSVAKGWSVKLLDGGRRRFTKLKTNPTVDFQVTLLVE